MKKMRIVSRGNGEITITGLSPEDEEKLQSIIVSGNLWMTVREGVPVFTPTFKGFPDPTEDLEIAPFWRVRLVREDESIQEHFKFFEFSPSSENYSPSIYINHLCGYNYTPEGYRETATKLTSYGFECMKSQRGSDGKFWETWYLPGLWSAKNDLQRAISHLKCDKEKLKETIEFLRKKVSFGQLDVSVQKLAMAAPD